MSTKHTLRAAVTAALVLAGAGTLAACGPPPPCLGRTPTIAGTAGNDVLKGTAGPDVIQGLGGNDTITGLGGNDTLCGGPGTDSVSGSEGADTLDSGPGRDTIAGGAGTDTLSYQDATAGVVVDLKAGRGPESDTIREVENLVGSRHNDWLTGSDARNVIRGGRGSDVLRGGVGNDDLLEDDSIVGEANTLIGGFGDDTLRGGAGRDVVSYDVAGEGGVMADLGAGTALGPGRDVLQGVKGIIGSPLRDLLYGTMGSDIISGAGGDDVIDPRVGDDTIDGGPGRDLVTFQSQPTGVRVDLAAERAVGDGSMTLRSIEDVWGSEQDDLLVGTSGSNEIDGADGTDTCDGRGGTDVITSCE